MSETQNGAKISVVVNGVLDPSTAPGGGQMPVMGADYLTAIYAVADNNSLFLWGSGKSSPRLNQFACPWLPIGTLAAEVFVA
jgi:hypothetical protein